MKTWKRAEKRVAEILGGQRVGNTGKATEDVRTRWLRVEVKTRKGLPLWIKRALAQVLRTTGPSQLWVSWYCTRRDSATRTPWSCFA
jgi:hypothetical protein